MTVLITGFGPFPGAPFTLGVASGDPLPDAVILWTRLAPEPLAGGGMPDVDVPVAWEIGMDEALTDVVASGTAIARPTLAHSVHVDATDLEPDTWYWYRFRVGEHTSPVGRDHPVPRAASDDLHRARDEPAHRMGDHAYWLLRRPALIERRADRGGEPARFGGNRLAPVERERRDVVIGGKIRGEIVVVQADRPVGRDGRAARVVRQPREAVDDTRSDAGTAPGYQHPLAAQARINGAAFLSLGQ